MAPSAITETSYHQSNFSSPEKRKGRPGEHRFFNGAHAYEGLNKTEFLFDRHLHKAFPVVTRAKGNWLYLKNGRKVMDSSAGAAVSALGHGDQRVVDAMIKQMQSGITYIASSFWSSDVVEDACEELIRGTNGKMSRVYLTGSGSEAMEASIKMARQYFLEKDKKSRRTKIIAREQSYHGNTLGALSVSGHVARRSPYLPFLSKNVHHVSACHPYRQRLPGETDAAFVARKAAELEAKFQELGPETVIGFVAEPVVGAALGCVPCVPGYLRAMRDVCHRHGALFILDEVMSGMGRCGTLHAWQAETPEVVPDIQTIGKGIAAGYSNIAAVLMAPHVVQTFLDGSGQFVHGQTYQGMPLGAAALLEVQRIVREENLVANVAKQGAYLEKELKRLLQQHPNVGDIRGRGLFWGIEFVQDKVSKSPFDPKLGIAQRVHDTALSEPFNVCVYPGTGTVDGYRGDHILISPAYIVQRSDIDLIVRAVAGAVEQVFGDVGHV